MDSRLLIERRENSEGRRDKRTNQREVKLELSGSRSAINCALCFLYFFFFFMSYYFFRKRLFRISNALFSLTVFSSSSGKWSPRSTASTSRASIMETAICNWSEFPSTITRLLVRERTKTLSFFPFLPSFLRETFYPRFERFFETRMVQVSRVKSRARFKIETRRGEERRRKRATKSKRRVSRRK